MRERNIEFHFMLTESEAKDLKGRAAKCGLSVQSYLRSLSQNKAIKEQPSADYLAILKALEKIGDNMNQIAAKANTLGYVDKVLYRKEADNLEKVIAELVRVAYS